MNILSDSTDYGINHRLIIFDGDYSESELIEYLGTWYRDRHEIEFDFHVEMPGIYKGMINYGTVVISW